MDAEFEGFEGELDDDYDISTPEHAGATLRRFLKTASDQWVRLTIVTLSIVCYTVLTVYAPFRSAGVVDLLWNQIQAANAAGVRFSITWADGGRDIFALLLVYLGVGAFYFLQSFLMASFAENISYRLRCAIADKLNRLPLAFFDKNKPGAILTHVTNDLDKASEAMQTGVLQLLSAAGMIVGSIAMMFYFNVWLTLVFLAFSAIAVFATKNISDVTLRAAERRQACVGAVTAMVEENYTGRTVVKAFCREDASSAALHGAAEQLAEASRKADFMVDAINPAIRLINRVGQVLLAVLGGAMLLRGRISVGVFQAFFQYVGQAAEPLTEIAYMTNSMQSALASFERVYGLLDEAELPPEPSAPYVPGEVRGEVEFRHVRFGYTKEKCLMQDVSFRALPGQKIAVVGSTGAGKTTLVNLLMRFYDTDGGEILLDGRDIREMTRADLRRVFGMVLQDARLFEGTIADNIAYGRPDATREEIVAAAKAARADFFIRTLPGGYDTPLDSDAEKISVGQRQLLTIARVLCCNPAVLILDEATSSVDTRTEIEIGKAVKNLLRGRTSFVIAHRLSTITDADLILYMEDGNIVESGNHETLLARGGRYAALYNSQFS